MWLLLTGCAHLVSITTYPAGASLQRDGTEVGNAPLEIPVPRFSSTRLAAAFPGYQTLEVVVPPRWWRRHTNVELRLSQERDPLQ